MKNSSDPKPPKHLSSEAKKWWEQVVADYTIDDAAALVLLTACEAFDRRREAREMLKKEGLVVQDRFGQPKPHPAASIERDAAATLLRAWRVLGLDVEPPGPIGRPPGRL